MRFDKWANDPQIGVLKLYIQTDDGKQHHIANLADVEIKCAPIEIGGQDNLEDAVDSDLITIIGRRI